MPILPKADLATLPSKPEVVPAITDHGLRLCTASVTATPVAVRMAKEEGVDLSKVPTSGDRITREDVERFIANQKSAGRVTVPATPAARRVARESGVPLETVAGSGPRGRVQSVDVLAMAKSVRSLIHSTANGREVEIIPLTSIRRTIAERMQQSFQESPHIALTVDVDMTEAENTRKRFNISSGKIRAAADHGHCFDDQGRCLGIGSQSRISMHPSMGIQFPCGRM